MSYHNVPLKNVWSAPLSAGQAVKQHYLKLTPIQILSVVDGKERCSKR